jgi:hypothetical protein
MLVYSSVSIVTRAAIAISPRLTQFQASRTSQNPIESKPGGLLTEALAGRARKPIMTDVEALQLARENDYLKLRCAQLQGDVTDLNSQVARLVQQLDRLHVVREPRVAGPAA